MTQLKLTPEAVALELLARGAAEKSLHEFTKQAWPQVEGGSPFIDNWHISAVCEHLEAVTRGDIKNLLINLPPRMTKSTLVGIMWPAWVWISDPVTKWLFSTYAHPLTMRDSRRCRALMRSKWYQVRFGDKFSFMEDADTLVRFDNNKGGYRIATAVDSATMGDGGDIIVCDDTNNIRDLSDNMLQSTIDWWTQVMPTRVNSFMTGRKVVMQQRTHQKDHSGYIMANDPKGWVKLILPMEFEEKRRCVTVVLPSTNGKPWRDPREKEGDILDPNRIGPKELKQLKKDLGSEYAVSGQLQQRPAPESGGIIKKGWFQIWKQPTPPKCDYVVLSVDTALTENKNSAYNAATTWGVFSDDKGTPNVILLSVWRERCEYPELRDRIKRMSQNYLDDGPTPIANGVIKKPDMVLIEAKVSGISLVQDLARAGVLATKFNPDKLGDKVQRVRMITPILEAGRVWLPGRPPDYVNLRTYADLFREQAAAFPNAESRDLIDTATMVLWRLQVSGFIWHRDDEGPPPDYSRAQAPGRRELYG